MLRPDDDDAFPPSSPNLSDEAQTKQRRAARAGRRAAGSATSVRVLRYERGERREGEWYDPHPTLPARRKPRG
jgi:hypothetical protein